MWNQSLRFLLRLEQHILDNFPCQGNVHRFYMKGRRNVSSSGIWFTLSVYNYFALFVAATVDFIMSGISPNVSPVTVMYPFVKSVNSLFKWFEIAKYLNYSWEAVEDKSGSERQNNSQMQHLMYICIKVDFRVGLWRITN